MSGSPCPVTNAASLLHWKILTISIDLTNCVCCMDSWILIIIMD